MRIQLLIREGKLPKKLLVDNWGPCVLLLCLLLARVTSKPQQSMFGNNSFDHLGALLSGLIERLNKKPIEIYVPTVNNADFSGFYQLSSSEGKDGEISECLSDPFNAMQPNHD